MLGENLLRQKKRQRYLIGVLIAAIVAGAGFYGFQFIPDNFFRFLAVPPPAPQPRIDLNFDIFTTDSFRELGDPPDPIGLPSESGRINPFAPL